MMLEHYKQHEEAINEFAKNFYDLKMALRETVNELNSVLASKRVSEIAEFSFSYREEYWHVKNLTDHDIEQLLLLDIISTEEKELIKEMWYESHYIRGNVNIIKLLGSVRAIIKDRYWFKDGKQVATDIYKEKALFTRQSL